MKKHAKGIGIYLVMVIFILLILMAYRLTESTSSQRPYTYSSLINQLDQGEIQKVEITADTDQPNAGKAIVTFKASDKTETVDIPSIESFIQKAEEASIKYETEIITNPVPKTSVFITFIPIIIMIILFICLTFFIFQQMQGGGGGSRVMSFGKSKAKMVSDDKNKVTFNNVAGLEEEKNELQELVDFLKQPKKFIEIGARIPKGVLLVGPPGTGKTLLAKAVAGEASVPFFSISGSDFVEMFVGVGASRVRDLFEQAKKHSPCIVFIDEIDAVGRRRGAGLGGGHDEREQTLNQLLVEMDGFGVNEGVIILAATNRPDILDPALLRPGRFDRQVVVGKPDVKAREEILAVHAKTKVMAEEVDLSVIARTTAGFTGADLENLINEAALLAVRNGKKEVDMEELRRAYVKVGMGTEKKSRIITDKDKRITAYHEAGHAILFEILSELDPVHMISVIPTGMAGGYTMNLPGEDRTHMSKKHMEQTITGLLGGRAAEYLVIKDITTGASNDIERATAIARSMVTQFGMSELLGPIQFGDESNEVFIGKDLAHARNYGEEVASKIDTEIKRIIEDSYQEALTVIGRHMDVLDKTAEVLMEKEKITGDEFRKLFPEGVLTKEIKSNKLLDSGNFMEPEAKGEPV